MARQIVILERQGAATRFRYLLWAVVPVARRAFYANASAISAFKDATATEITALRNGEVVEQVETLSMPGANANQIKAELVTRFAAFQAEVNGTTEWSRYGSYFQDGAWVDNGA